MIGEFWIANSRETLENAVAELYRQWDEHKWIEVKFTTGKNRTQKQQAAIEVYCRLLAEELNRQGITFEQFFREGYKVPWSQQIVKDNVWRLMQKAVCSKQSSRDLNRSEVGQVYDHINMHLSEKHGIYVPWPEREKDEVSKDPQRRQG